MKRLWNWIVDQKTTTVRKWRSSVLNSTQLKPIGGSDDELGREQRRNSKNFLEVGDGHKTSISLQDFENFEDYKPLNFEEFFEESSGAIESALVRKHTLSPQLNRRKLSPAPEQLTSSPSLDSRSSSLRPRDRPQRPNVTSMDADSTEVEDELYDELERLPSFSALRRRHTSVVPHVSVSFADEPSTSVIVIGEESDNVLSSSSFSNRARSIDDTEETTENRAAGSRQPSASATVSGTTEDYKDKLEQNRKISPVQLRRLSNAQVAQSLSGRRTSTTLLPLTSAQIHLIRTIWRQVYVTKGPTVIGSTLLHRIFFKSVKTKEQFLRCSFPHHFPNRDSFNKAHAKATGELIDKIVDNLENLESISDCLFTIGVVHARLPGQEISRKIWNLMAETFIDCTLEWGDKKGRTETVRKAWALIIAFVIEKIKEGHTHERRQIAQTRRSSWVTAAQLSTAIASPSSVPTVRFQESVDEVVAPTNF